MESHARPPSELSSEGSMDENWKNWKQQFLIFLKASGLVDKPTATKACALLNLMGTVGQQLAYNDFEYDCETDIEDMDILIKKFDEHFDPKGSEAYARYIFFSSARQQNETIDQYVKALKMRAKTCNFGELQDGLIRDKIVLEMKNNTLRKQLLGQADLSLNETIIQWKTYAPVETPMRSCLPMNQDTGIKPKCLRQFSDKTTNCGRCGAVHEARHCPARGQKCGNCGMMNHLAEACTKPSMLKKDSNEAPTALKYFNTGPITKIPGFNKETAYD